MQWNKKGLIFKAENKNQYLSTHASNPLAIKLSNDVYRVYFSGRNFDNKSSIGYFDYDIKNEDCLGVSEKPLVIFGDDTSFYKDGISIGNLYENNGKKYVLFMGWNIPTNQHWRGDIGQLEVTDFEHMHVTSEIPFMGMSEEDPISLSYPYVMFVNDKYKMWYGSTIDWTSENGEMIHVIKYATSKNGIDWERKGVCIPYKLGEAQAFSRPTVILLNEVYHMWYSYRSGDGTKYRIGYSYSFDGETWIARNDKVGLSVSDSPDENIMVCYPYVIIHEEQLFMFYNGNDYGKKGVFLATISVEDFTNHFNRIANILI
jgi:hypothetical protein